MSITVDIDCHLVVGVTFKRYSNGDKPSVRLTINKPALAAHEIAIAVSLKLPVGLFKKPSLTATIEVPEDSAPPRIDVEMQSNIARVIREQTGIHLTISAPEEPTP